MKNNDIKKKVDNLLEYTEKNDCCAKVARKHYYLFIHQKKYSLTKLEYQVLKELMDISYSLFLKLTNGENWSLSEEETQ